MLCRLHHRRQVRARIDIDVMPAVVCDRHIMIGIAVGQPGQLAAVEIHAVQLPVVRVLSRIHAAGGEPDAPLRVVHAQHIAHDPRPVRELPLEPAAAAIDQVQVPPAVAFGNPQQRVAAPIHVMPEAAVGVDEGARIFADRHVRATALRIHRDHPHALKAALHVVEAHAAAIAAPLQRRQRIRIGEQGGVHLAACAVHGKQHRPLHIHRIAWLGVQLGAHARLAAACRRRFHAGDAAGQPRTHAIHRQPLRIRRPGDAFRVEVIVCAAIVAEPGQLAIGNATQQQVPAIGERFPAAIGRTARRVVGWHRWVAHHTEAAWTLLRGGVIAGAAVVRQAATPGRFAKREANRPVAALAVRRIGKALEWQLQRGVGCAGRGTQCLRHAQLVERRRFLQRGDIHTDEGESARHRLAVMEAAGGLPLRRPGHVLGQRAPLRAQAQRALVVGHTGRGLCRSRQQHDARSHPIQAATQPARCTHAVAQLTRHRPPPTPAHRCASRCARPSDR